MKRTLLALGVAVGLAVAVGAAERPEKKKPADAKSYDEGTKAFPVGEKVTVNVTQYVPTTVTKTVRVGNEVKAVTETVLVPVQASVVVVVPARKWTLGAEGWHDKEGFNVDKARADGPLAKVRTLDGNKESFRQIEPNDVIAKIDGRPVATELALYLAIQGAAAPEKLSLEVISAKDGKTYTGTVSAAKPKQ